MEICTHACIWDGCKKITEATISAGDFVKPHPLGKCKSYESPKTQWARGKTCPMSRLASERATALTMKDAKKINPLKASKRGA